MDLTGIYDASTPVGAVTVTLQASPDGRLQGEVRTGPIVLRLAGSTDGVRGEGTATSDGDRLQVTANGQTESLARIDLDDPMQAAAGVWAATESHVDPSIAMVISQYVTLYPDGAASFQKTEGGASRSQVSESLERFSSFRHTGQRSVNGRWRSDGVNVEVQWGWRNAPVVGRVDLAAGKLVLADVGILVEGATLTYDRR